MANGRRNTWLAIQKRFIRWRKSSRIREQIWSLSTHKSSIAWSHTGEVLDMKTGRMVVPYMLDVPLIRESNRLIATRCAEAGMMALSDLAPASLLIGRGEAKGISFIRRFRMNAAPIE